jgi:hypothetical protein
MVWKACSRACSFKSHSQVTSCIFWIYFYFKLTRNLCICCLFQCSISNSHWNMQPHSSPEMSKLTLMNPKTEPSFLSGYNWFKLKSTKSLNSTSAETLPKCTLTDCERMSSKPAIVLVNLNTHNPFRILPFSTTLWLLSYRHVYSPNSIVA